jgi:hypothetical protein
MKGSFGTGVRCLGILFLVLSARACASHHGVTCYAHLEPINPAQPKTVQGTLR